MSEDRATRDARLFAEIEADVTAERIGAVYAEAFLGMASGAGRAAELIEEFDSLIDDVLAAFPALAGTLASGLVSHEEKVGILDRVLGGRASREMLNFLKVVSHHGRLAELRVIHREVRKQYETVLGHVPVQVSTAVPLDDQQADALAGALRAVVHGEPVIERITDPGLIGGMVVRVGDTVYDASVVAQLEIVRQQMIDRSAHEIQSRRDRFRDPAGN